jgi:hypothetical protein
LHLMDIKRVAFETRPVKSARPAVGAGTSVPAQPTPREPVVGGGKINRDEIAAIVDRFLAGKRIEPSATSPLPAPPPVEAEAGSMYSGSITTSAPAEVNGGNGKRPAVEPAPAVVRSPSTNGNKPVEFVSEDDVRRALQKGEKIYITARTIITPSARDLGDPAEVFAKV